MLPAGTVPARPQDDRLATWAPRLLAADRVLEWSLPRTRSCGASARSRRIPARRRRSVVSHSRCSLPGWITTRRCAGRPGTVVGTDHRGVLVASGEGGSGWWRSHLPAGSAWRLSAWASGAHGSPVTSVSDEFQAHADGALGRARGDPQSVIDERAYSNLVVPGLLGRSGLDERDRAFAAELAYGTLRRRIPIDHAIEARASRPISRMTSGSGTPCGWARTRSRSRPSRPTRPSARRWGLVGPRDGAS